MSDRDLSTAQKAKIVHIDAERAGQRIDNFLMASFKGVPKSRVYSMLRKGEVRVNKGRVKPGYRLTAGDAVRLPPVRVSEPGAPLHPGQAVLQRIEESILMENKGFLALNKPAGLAVHGGSGVSFGIIEALRFLRPDAHYLELVHRLDRETSGCLLIAKKRSLLRQLHALLRGEAGEMDKRYTTLLKGPWQGGARRVDAPLRKNTLRSGERMVNVEEQGKPSVTLFVPQTHFQQGSLMQVQLFTGRTHQIRVHAAHIGHPIAGDEKYGDDAYNASMRQFGLNRLFLHAHRLSFTLPESEQGYDIEAPLTPELVRVLKQLTPKP